MTDSRSPRALPQTTGGGRPLVLFDGVCNLCHASVRFIIERDPAGIFQFTSLQSATGQRIATAHGVDPLALDSMLLLEGGRLHRRSTAALRIARHLHSPWRLAFAFIVVPAFVRDAVYDFVGRRRYRWFGRRELCAVPVAGAEDRFID